MSYSIGQVAEKTGLTSYTLRYYDREGLMPFVHRSPAGRREFTDDDLDFIDLITCLKATGMQLAEIRKFVELAMQGDATLETRLAIFKAKSSPAAPPLSKVAATFCPSATTRGLAPSTLCEHPGGGDAMVTGSVGASSKSTK